MASRKTLLIPILNEIIVSEIGEANITPLNWTKISPIKCQFFVEINGKIEEVTVDFERIGAVEKDYYLPPLYRHLNKIYNVGYDVSGAEKQFAKTNVKTLLTIMSTVVDIIKNFIKNHHPEGLYIAGTPKTLAGWGESQKSALYKAFISKQLQQFPDFGFDTYRDGFILVKN